MGERSPAMEPSSTAQGIGAAAPWALTFMPYLPLPHQAPRHRSRAGSCAGSCAEVPPAELPAWREQSFLHLTPHHPIPTATRSAPEQHADRICLSRFDAIPSLLRGGPLPGIRWVQELHLRNLTGHDKLTRSDGHKYRCEYQRQRRKKRKSLRAVSKRISWQLRLTAAQVVCTARRSWARPVPEGRSKLGATVSTGPVLGLPWSMRR